MKNNIIKISVLIVLFLSIQLNCFGATLENFEIELDKTVVHPGEEVTVKIDFGKMLSEFEVNIAYDKNIFQFQSIDKDINLYDNGDIATLTYPTTSSKEPISKLEISFKAREDITGTSPTDLKVTLQKMKDGLTNEFIENPLLPIENKLVVEPINEDYEFMLKSNVNIKDEVSEEIDENVNREINENINENIDKKTNTSVIAKDTTNEVEYKPTKLPKAGSTIYFLILPAIGILILIYCIFKKKDENF